MRLILLGDVMLGRLVNRHLQSAPFGWPWGDTLPLLHSADALVLNLECVLSDRGEPWPQKTFTFRSDAKNVAVLEQARVSAVSLANNHSLDFGSDALDDCLRILDAHGIYLAGAGRDREEARRPASFVAHGVRIALIAATDNEPEWEASSDRPGVFHVDIDPPGRGVDELIELVQQAAAAHELVVVSLHWGGNWGDEPPRAHRRLAHRLIDAGAGVVFGHSPHVTRGVELYRGRPILYACGDFVDDYAVDEVDRNDWSFAFVLDWDRGALRRLRLVPTVIRELQARLAQGAEREAIEARMAGLSARLGTRLEHREDGLEWSAESSWPLARDLHPPL